MTVYGHEDLGWLLFAVFIVRIRYPCSIVVVVIICYVSCNASGLVCLPSTLPVGFVSHALFWRVEVCSQSPSKWKRNSKNRRGS